MCGTGLGALLGRGRGVVEGRCESSEKGNGRIRSCRLGRQSYSSGQDEACGLQRESLVGHNVGCGVV